MKKTQRDTVLDLLRRHTTVTLRMFFDAGIGYTARNRISELKKEGFQITQSSGPTPSENSYTLISEPAGSFVYDGAGQGQLFGEAAAS